MSTERFPQMRSEPESTAPDHDPSMEEWWDLFLEMQKAVTEGERECAEYQAQVDSDTNELIEMRTRVDALESKYLERFESDESALEIVRKIVLDLRVREKELEASIARSKQIIKNLSEANARMKERVTELHEELKEKRH